LINVLTSSIITHSTSG